MKQLARRWRRALGLVLALALVFSYAPATIAYAEDPEGTAIVADGSQEAAPADVQEETQEATQEDTDAPTPGSEVVPSGTTSNDDGSSEGGSSEGGSSEGGSSEDEKKPEDETPGNQLPAPAGCGPGRSPGRPCRGGDYRPGSPPEQHE